MKVDFLFAGLNQNRTIQTNRCQNKAHFMDDVFLKTSGITYLNVVSWFFLPPTPIKIYDHVPGSAPSKIYLCCVDFGSTCALDVQHSFLHSSNEQTALRSFLGIYSSFL